MNVHDDEDSLALTRPFLDFGLSAVGEQLILLTGYAPIPEMERVIMRTRAQTDSGVKKLAIAATPCGPKHRDIKIAGSSTVYPVAKLWVSRLKRSEETNHSKSKPLLTIHALSHRATFTTLVAA